KYTLAFSGGTNAATSPAGLGVGTLTVSGSGTVGFAGTVAEGTAVATAVPLAQNGQWPIYLPLYGGKGSLFGWMTLDNMETTDITGLVLWSKPRGVPGAFYPAGFTNE